MKKLPIILTLILIIAWAYTCWYWYTCNIKWFCDETTSYTLDQTWDNTTYQSQETQKEEIWTEPQESSPKLSAEDVLFDALPKEIEQKEENNKDIQEEEKNEEELLSVSDREVESTEKDEDNRWNTQEEVSICKSPLVWSIALWGDNDKTEVEKLESFLISRGENISIDGEYWNDDLEAVKRFQLEYKEDVLDPWDIVTPTGYVGRTSIAKINEIACK